MGKHILAGDGTWQPVPLIVDPMERMIADALEASGIAYQPEGPATSNLDFRLFNGVHIEVDVPAICAGKRAALLAALRFVDTEAGILNGVPNEPSKAVGAPDDIAMDLADAFGVPFDENWPESVVAQLLKEQQP